MPVEFYPNNFIRVTGCDGFITIESQRFMNEKPDTIYLSLAQFRSICEQRNKIELEALNIPVPESEE